MVLGKPSRWGSPGVRTRMERVEQVPEWNTQGPGSISATCMAAGGRGGELGRRVAVGGMGACRSHFHASKMWDGRWREGPGHGGVGVA